MPVLWPLVAKTDHGPPRLLPLLDVEGVFSLGWNLWRRRRNMRPSSVAKTPQRVFSLSPYDGCVASSPSSTTPRPPSPLFADISDWVERRTRKDRSCIKRSGGGIRQVKSQHRWLSFEVQLESSWAFCARNIAHSLLFAKKNWRIPLFHIFPLAPAIFIPFPPRAFPPLWQCAMWDPPLLRGEIPHAFASPPRPSSRTRPRGRAGDVWRQSRMHEHRETGA